MKPALYLAPLLIASQIYGGSFKSGYCKGILSLEKKGDPDLFVPRAPAGGPSIRVSFHDSKGKKYPLAFSPHETIFQIKKRLQKLYRKRVHKLLLTSGLALQDSRTFKSYGLAPTDKVIILFKPAAY